MPKSQTIRQQVAYASSPLALATAQAIIEMKIINSQRLLGLYYQSRKRAGDDRSDGLLGALNRLENLATRSHHSQNRLELFQIEAQAARVYWTIFKQLCHQDSNWTRVHPHAGDPLNILLNSGYVMLARQCLKALNEAGLMPEIGLLHGDNSGQPLVYDLMEIFRQSAVDNIILPHFSRRHKTTVSKDDHAFRKILALLNRHYEKYFWYERRCEKLETIIRLEAIGLKQAILTDHYWKPYRHPWSRHHICRQ